MGRMAEGGLSGSGKSSPLEGWIARQYDISARSMLRAISATDLVKERRGFGQAIRPIRGSIVASTAMGNWDPDPDYFYHWLRDSAIVVDAVRQLIADGTHAREGLVHLRDFVAFSHALNRLDGGTFLWSAGDFRNNVDPGFLKYVRGDEDLRSIYGDRLLGEPRFNPDATLDISKWSRPQHDGPALRALALMRSGTLDALDDADRASMRALILNDLGFVARNWREPCFDIWEEELGHHYYTRLVHYAALADGARWIEAARESHAGEVQGWRAAAQEIARSLDAYWDPGRGFYVSRSGVENGAPGKDLDFATILAVNHAGRGQGAHSVLDPRVMATLASLEELFGASYPINKDRPPNRGPAIGRYAGDNYFSGGAYYFSTFGAAEFYYRLARLVVEGASFPVAAENKGFLLRAGADSAFALEPFEQRTRLFEALFKRGEEFMATIAAYTPASGALSEQFDQATGEQTSAKDLAWSHAAFITAAAQRKAALCAFDLRVSKSSKAS